MTARQIATASASERIDAPAAGRLATLLYPLFVVTAVLRAGLIALLVLEATYLLDLLGTSGLGWWLVLGVTAGVVASVLLDDCLDLEGRIAAQVAQAAVFDPDPFGARAEAVRSYVDVHLRSQGCVARSRMRIRDPDTNQSFRVYFPMRRANCRRWCSTALLTAGYRTLQFITAGLVFVVAVQAYVLGAG